MTTDRHPPIRTLAVVGAGTMGSGIAQKMAIEGFDVAVVDVDEAKVARGIAAIEKSLAEGVARRVLTTDQVATAMKRVRGTARFEDLAGADLVVEAVFEDLGLKKEVFQRLDRTCRPDAILATNTSSYSVTELAAATSRPERVVGLHYFYHPAKNRLVEVVPGAKTDRAVFGRAWELQEILGKTPIASRDSFGFIVNRFFAPWLNEAVRMLEQGAAGTATIDAAAKKTFGIGMGPFELMNVTGLPIALHTATTLWRAFGPMYEPAPLLRAQVASATMWDLAGTPEATRLAAIGDRLLAVVFFVASALVDERAGSIEDTDIGARVGLRWPSGPFELMNQLGVRRAEALVKEFAAKWTLSVPDALARQARTAQPFAFTVVRTDIADSLATLTINRPDALNALDERVVDQLRAAFRAAVANPAVKGIVLAGSGKAFVAGADIRFFLRHIDSGHLERIVAFTQSAQELLREIEKSPKPVVARVHGLALGGGVELALACHSIVATPKAALGFPETGIGIYPGLGGTQRTTRRIGKGLAKWLVLTGQAIGAEEALAIGLVDRVVPHEALGDVIANEVTRGIPIQRDFSDGSADARAVPESHRALAGFFDSNDAETLRLGLADARGDERLAGAMRRVASKAPIALRLASELVDRGVALPLEEGLRMELDHLTEIFSTKDAYEGLSRLGGPPPHFEGR